MNVGDLVYSLTLIVAALLAYLTQNVYGLAFLAVLALIRIGDNIS